MTMGRWPRERRTFRTASRWLIGIMLSLTLCGLFLAISATQLTAPGTGQRILAQGIAVLTDMDSVLTELHADLQTEAALSEEPTTYVPGFPIAIELSTAEAMAIDPETLRERILGNSAELAYEEGIGVLEDPGGEQDIDLLSPAGAIDRGLGLVTRDNYTRIAITTGVLASLATALAMLLLISMRSYASVIVLGAAVAAATIPPIAGIIAARFIFRAALTDADPFVQGLLELGLESMWLPLRNEVAFGILGVALMVLGILIVWMTSRWSRSFSNSANHHYDAPH